jgi:uncharacterized protein YyaL (SSP411 family)
VNAAAARFTVVRSCLLLAGVIAATTSCRNHGAPGLPAGGSRANPVDGLSFLAGPLPGAPPIPAVTIERLRSAWRTRPVAYRPRTHHLGPDGRPRYTNRLFLSASPYLRQHAHNPTNWYAWGGEAFETARRLHRPVLLSIGYSTCHWCHVMEEESFEDEEVARFINENYVAIKVDREERPDIDAVYMAAVQMLTGGGGWPLTVWLTADRKPFYGGTYFPARDGDRGAGVGFLTLLRQLRSLHDQQPARIAESAAQIVDGIGRRLAGDDAGAELPGPASMQALADFYRRRFDPVNGGTAGAPKFPSNLSVRFLLRLHRRTGDEEALRMASLTLEKMAQGGIHDHVGGGFHRYSTDDHWLVPHFEKMLYDNALLVVAYLEAFQATRRSDFAAVARETLRYLARDMISPEGAFTSATDADSPAPGGRPQEGWFFTWTPAEIAETLGATGAALATACYGVSVAGNVEGRSILALTRPIEDLARRLRVRPAALRAELDEIDERLYLARARRPAPARDDKVLTAWNGLAISAFARAAQVLGDGEYAQRAASAADFVLSKMRRNGRLTRAHYSAGEGFDQLDAYLEDYAFMIAGLLDLFEATGEARWLREASALDGVLARSYEDPRHGGYFSTSGDHEALLAREKRGEDGAEPSGNSVQALNLLRLHGLTGADGYRRRAEATLRAFSGTLARAPAVLAEMMLAVDYFLDEPKEIVILTAGKQDHAGSLLARLGRTFVPNHVLVVAAGNEDAAAVARVAPIADGKIVQHGKPTAYVCRRGVCDLPTSDPDAFERQLQPAKNPRAR